MSQQNTIKIILVEDHVLVRQAIRSLLETEPHYSVIKEYDNGTDFLTDEIYLDSDLVLIDISLPDISGIEIFKRLKGKCGSTKLVALTAKTDPKTLRLCLQKGADGFVVKESESDELFEGIEKIISGKTFVSDFFMHEMEETVGIHSGPPPIEFFKLTKREKDVLQLTLEKAKNKDIAEDLFISTKAVEKHKRNIFSKCDVRNSAGVLKLFHIK